MAEGLPEGLVSSNTEVVSDGIESHDRVDPEDLARLWRAYATNRRLLINDIGRRLENFFWRLWGSPRCQERLQGSQVALLFALISEGEIIRTTPIPSPRTSRMVPRTVTQDLPSSSLSQAPTSQTTVEKGESSVSECKTADDSKKPPTTEEDKGRRRSSSKPAPILKRPGIESGSKKSATILTPTWKTVPDDPDHDEAETTKSRRLSGRSPISTDIAEDYDDNGEYSERHEPKSSATFKGKKKATFFVGAGKRRPTLNRRKSSQSSSGNSTKISSPNIGSGSPVPSNSRNEMEFKAPFEDRTTRHSGFNRPGHPRSRSVSPVSSSPFKRTTRDHLPTSEPPIGETARDEDLIVSQNFRGSFMDKLRSQGISGTKSPAATGLSTSFQASGSSSGALQDSKDTKKATVSQDPGDLTLDRLPSQTTLDNVSPTTLAGLPRVRSQLTTLLKDNQEYSQGRKTSVSSKRKSKRSKKTTS